jgi:alcohol dehydrogenase class IV
VSIVIAIGGGSTIDCARASILLATHSGPLEDYAVDGTKGIPGITSKCIPLISVPTLFGTGSEISVAAVVTINGVRRIIVSPHLRPRAALVESRVATSAPLSVARAAAFDAFIQSLEALLSRSGSVFSGSLAVASMRNSLVGLASLRDSIHNEDVAESCFVGGLLSSLAISVGGVGAIHALSNPLTARFGTRHGRALAVVASAVLSRSAVARKAEFQEASELMVRYYFGQHMESTHGELPQLVKQLTLDLDLVPPKKELERVCNNIDALAREAINPDMMSNPVDLAVGEIKQIYLESVEA